MEAILAELDLITNIISYLNINDLVAFSSTCKKLRDDEQLWRKAFLDLKRTHFSDCNISVCEISISNSDDGDGSNTKYSLIFLKVVMKFQLHGILPINHIE